MDCEWTLNREKLICNSPEKFFPLSSSGEAIYEAMWKKPSLDACTKLSSTSKDEKFSVMDYEWTLNREKLICNSLEKFFPLSSSGEAIYEAMWKNQV